MATRVRDASLVEKWGSLEILEGIPPPKSAWGKSTGIDVVNDEEAESYIQYMDDKYLKEQDAAARLSQRGKHLIVCFMASANCHEAFSYSVWSIAVNDLVGDALEEAENLQLLHSWVTNDECIGRSCVHIGSQLYFLGGQMPTKFPVPSYSLVDMSGDVYCLDLSQMYSPFSDSAFLSILRLKEMQFGKACPVAVEIGGKLYVLAGPPYSNDIPDPSFEMYDPNVDCWSSLGSPPLLIKSSKYFSGFPDAAFDTLSYVVIDDKLCVSSLYASFAYDITEKRWETCELFDGFCSESWVPAHIDDQEKIESGPPFDFSGGAIVYDGDVLICRGRGSFLVFAFQMDDGKVVRKQKLLERDPLEYKSCLVADLGGGYFCCLCDKNPSDRDKSCVSLLTFKVSKEGAFSSDEFLIFEFVSELDHQCSDLEPWSDGPWTEKSLPLYAFIL